jgi:hypothetical protein
MHIVCSLLMTPGIDMPMPVSLACVRPASLMSLGTVAASRSATSSGARLGIGILMAARGLVARSVATHSTVSAMSLKPIASPCP